MMTLFYAQMEKKLDKLTFAWYNTHTQNWCLHIGVKYAIILVENRKKGRKNNEW